MLCAPAEADENVSRQINLAVRLLKALQEQRLAKPPGDARPAASPTKDVENFQSS